MGMTIDNAIKHGEEQLEIFGGEHNEFIQTAIDIMRKYQKIENIVIDEYYLSDYNKINDIREVLENGVND